MAITTEVQKLENELQTLRTAMQTIIYDLQEYRPNMSTQGNGVMLDIIYKEILNALAGITEPSPG